MGQLRQVPPDSGRSLFLQGEVQLGGQPQPPQGAQGVLLEAPVRVAHAPHQLPLQVGPPSEPVHQPRRPPGHGVDGEVPPGQVVLQPGGEGHPVGPAVVGVALLPAEGGHLHPQAVQLHRHRAEAAAGVVLGAAGEEGPDLLRPGGGGRVIVVGGKAQQAVPDAAPHQGGVEARPAQPLHRRQGAGIKFQHTVPLLFSPSYQTGGEITRKTRLGRSFSRWPLQSAGCSAIIS